MKKTPKIEVDTVKNAGKVKKMKKRKTKKSADKKGTQGEVLNLMKKHLPENVVKMVLHARKVQQDGENPDVPEYKCATCGHYRDGKCYREEFAFVFKVNPFVNKCFVHTNYGASIHQFKLGAVKRDAS